MLKQVGLSLGGFALGFATEAPAQGYRGSALGRALSALAVPPPHTQLPQPTPFWHN